MNKTTINTFPTCKLNPVEEYKIDSMCLDMITSEFDLASKTASEGAFSKTYIIQSKKEPHNKYVLKLIIATDKNLDELLISCCIRRNLISTYTLSFMYVHKWFICDKLPDWETPIQKRIFEKNTVHKYIYQLLPYADYLLDDVFGIEDLLTAHDFKCIAFELIYALAIARKELAFEHNDIKPDNIMLRIYDKPREYQINGTKYIVNSKYLPVFIDYGMAHINNNKCPSTVTPRTINVNDPTTNGNMDAQNLIAVLGDLMGSDAIQDLSQEDANDFVSATDAADYVSGGYTNYNALFEILMAAYFNELREA